MASAAERKVMALMLQSTAETVGSVLADAERAGEGYPVLAAVAATRSLGVIVDDVLHALVDEARSSGHTWQEIGDVLHVTRQAAFQRFGAGEAGDDRRRSQAMTEMPDAEERAVSILDDAVAGRWDAVRADFDDRMLAGASVEVLAAGWDQVVGMVGEFVELGEPGVRATGGYAVVDVPMTFARGEMKGRIAFSPAGQVAGFFLLNPDVA
ncbi:MAG: DUF3887 domain-containing protein [Acidimicrobiales bacterium]